jgi:hypothetical protein
MKNVRLVGHIVFSGDLDIPPDPDAAELALRRLGYTVARLPDRLRHRITVPGDDFMQAYVDVRVADEWKAASDDEWKAAGAIMDEVNAIVDGYGGACLECGVEPLDYEPVFDDLFEVYRRPH